MSNKLNDLIKDGKHQSPVLDPSIKNYLIDIDGTITEDVPNEEPERMLTVEPFPDALRTCNKWYDEGHIITFFTSRTEDLRAITEEWLNRHGFKYQNLLMNKPRGGNYHWIDNHRVRATEFKGNFSENFRTKKVNVELFEELEEEE
ncbi:MAG: phosphoheptose isomerase [Flavobacteriales bacterium]|nr:phosphoheptose isomerase [Bacteroidota bacterium]MCB9240725.1 phosphoheptose isomerase [Flavobacteriales bacterium]